jgi:DNA topoisomerase-3
VARQRLTEAQAKALLAGKTTSPITGFKSKAGKAFSARLKLDGERVAFVFDEKPKRPPAKAGTPRRRSTG